MHADAPPAAPGGSPDAALWQALGWQPGPQQLQQLCLLQELLRCWNQRLNLTRLVEGDDYWIAQVFDSLWPLLPLLAASASQAPAAAGGPGQSGGDPEACGPAGEGLRVIDIGTGGGFPGLAVAIALPGARITLVDSVQRKLTAVEAMAAELGLADRVQLLSERVEQTGRRPDCRGRFQLAMARAVAAAPVVAEYLVPLLAADGQALLYRGQWTADDRQTLEGALMPLRARISRCDQRELPAGRGLRTALTVVPSGTCPAAYPRAVGIPAKLPLGRPGPATGSTPAQGGRGRQSRRAD